MSLQSAIKIRQGRNQKIGVVITSETKDLLSYFCFRVLLTKS